VRCDFCKKKERKSPRSDVYEIDRAEAIKKDDSLEKIACSSKTVSKNPKIRLKERITNSLYKVLPNSVRFHLNLRKKGSSVKIARDATEATPTQNLHRLEPHFKIIK